MPSYNELRRAFGLRAGAVVHRDHRREHRRALDRAHDPHMLDFTGLRNIHGADIDLADTANAASALRRTTLAARLKLVYGSVEKVDAFTGMLAESHVLGSDFGELQLAMWKRQFEALRDGDRFYYLNDPALALIERDYGISARRTLAQVIRDNTDEDVRDDVFRLDGVARPSTTARAASARPWRPRSRSRVGAARELRRLHAGHRPRLHREHDRDRALDRRRRGALKHRTPRLANGSFALAQPLRVAFSRAAWDAPTSNEPVTITFTQAIGADRAAAHRRLRGDGHVHARRLRVLRTAQPAHARVEVHVRPRGIERHAA